MNHLLQIILTLILFSTNIYADIHKEDQFDKIINSKKFKVNVSNTHLANMHKASTLLISCVDFRLRDEVEKFMREDLKLLDDYDEIAIAGASLALESPRHPHWKQTVMETIDILKSLHHIKRIILLDHRECGAYKLVLGEEHAANKDIERDTHVKIMRDAKATIKKQFPDLEVYTLLMGLDGLIEHIQD